MPEFNDEPITDEVSESIGKQLRKSLVRYHVVTNTRLTSFNDSRMNNSLREKLDPSIRARISNRIRNYLEGLGFKEGDEGRYTLDSNSVLVIDSRPFYELIIIGEGGDEQRALQERIVNDRVLPVRQNLVAIYPYKSEKSFDLLVRKGFTIARSLGYSSSEGSVHYSKRTDMSFFLTNGLMFDREEGSLADVPSNKLVVVGKHVSDIRSLSKKVSDGLELIIGEPSYQ